MIPMRGHHGMCFAFFRGKGYSDSFTAHMTLVQQLLQENPLVQVLNTPDEVCSACPNLENGVCTSPDQVKAYDDSVLKLCGLEPGTVLPWNDFSELVHRHILSCGKRETICGDCRWSSICK